MAGWRDLAKQAPRAWDTSVQTTQGISSGSINSLLSDTDSAKNLLKVADFSAYNSLEKGDDKMNFLQRVGEALSFDEWADDVVWAMKQYHDDSGKATPLKGALASTLGIPIHFLQTAGQKIAGSVTGSKKLADYEGARGKDLIPQVVAMAKMGTPEGKYLMQQKGGALDYTDFDEILNKGNMTQGAQKAAKFATGAVGLAADVITPSMFVTAGGGAVAKGAAKSGKIIRKGVKAAGVSSLEALAKEAPQEAASLARSALKEVGIEASKKNIKRVLREGPSFIERSLKETTKPGLYFSKPFATESKLLREGSKADTVARYLDNPIAAVFGDSRRLLAKVPVGKGENLGDWAREINDNIVKKHFEEGYSVKASNPEGEKVAYNRLSKLRSDLAGAKTRTALKEGEVERVLQDVLKLEDIPEGFRPENLAPFKEYLTGNISYTDLNGYLKNAPIPIEQKAAIAKAFKQVEEKASKRSGKVGEKAINKDSVKWARSAKNGYEVSSAGDKEFSALNAKLADGRTIEEAYQLDIKGYRAKGNDWKLGKGKPPLREISKEQSWKEYKDLWRTYLKENPESEKRLLGQVKGKILTDKFAKTEVSQARALAEILNEEKAVKGEGKTLKAAKEAKTVQKLGNAGQLAKEMEDLDLEGTLLESGFSKGDLDLIGQKGALDTLRAKHYLPRTQKFIDDYVRKNPKSLQASMFKGEGAKDLDRAYAHALATNEGELFKKLPEDLRNIWASQSAKDPEVGGLIKVGQEGDMHGSHWFNAQMEYDHLNDTLLDKVAGIDEVLRKELEITGAKTLGESEEIIRKAGAKDIDEYIKITGYNPLNAPTYDKVADLIDSGVKPKLAEIAVMEPGRYKLAIENEFQLEIAKKKAWGIKEAVKKDFIRKRASERVDDILKRNYGNPKYYKKVVEEDATGIPVSIYKPKFSMDQLIKQEWKTAAKEIDMDAVNKQVDETVQSYMGVRLNALESGKYDPLTDGFEVHNTGGFTLDEIKNEIGDIADQLETKFGMDKSIKEMYASVFSEYNRLGGKDMPLSDAKIRLEKWLTYLEWRKDISYKGLLEIAGGGEELETISSLSSKATAPYRIALASSPYPGKGYATFKGDDLDAGGMAAELLTDKKKATISVKYGESPTAFADPSLVKGWPGEYQNPQSKLPLEGIDKKSTTISGSAKRTWESSKRELDLLGFELQSKKELLNKTTPEIKRLNKRIEETEETLKPLVTKHYDLQKQVKKAKVEYPKRKKEIDLELAKYRLKAALNTPEESRKKVLAPIEKRLKDRQADFDAAEEALYKEERVAREAVKKVEKTLENLTEKRSKFSDTVREYRLARDAYKKQEEKVLGYKKNFEKISKKKSFENAPIRELREGQEETFKTRLTWQQYLQKEAVVMREKNARKYEKLVKDKFTKDVYIKSGELETVDQRIKSMAKAEEAYEGAIKDSHKAAPVTSKAEETIVSDYVEQGAEGLSEQTKLIDMTEDQIGQFDAMLKQAGFSKEGRKRMVEGVLAYQEVASNARGFVKDFQKWLVSVPMSNDQKKQIGGMLKEVFNYYGKDFDSPEQIKGVLNSLYKLRGAINNAGQLDAQSKVIADYFNEVLVKPMEEQANSYLMRKKWWPESAGMGVVGYIHKSMDTQSVFPEVSKVMNRKERKIANDALMAAYNEVLGKGEVFKTKDRIDTFVKDVIGVQAGQNSKLTAIHLNMAEFINEINSGRAGELIKNFPEGTTPNKEKWVKMDDIPFLKDTNVWAHKDIAKEFDSLINFYNKGEVNEIIKHFNTYNDFWKVLQTGGGVNLPKVTGGMASKLHAIGLGKFVDFYNNDLAFIPISPGFTLRNIGTNLVSTAVVTGATAKEIAEYTGIGIDMIRAMKKLTRSSETSLGLAGLIKGSRSEKQIVELLEKSIDGGLWGTTFKGAEWMDPGITKSGLSQKVLKIAEQNRSLDFNQNIEMMNKLGIFAREIESGKSVQEAVAMVDRALFDYSKLTATERDIIKPLTVFYTWTKRNIELMSQIALGVGDAGADPTAAKRLRFMSKLLLEPGRQFSTTSEEEQSMLPEWVGNTTNMTFKDDKGQANIVSGYGANVEALADWFNGPKSAWGSAIDMLAPTYKLPLNMLGTGMNTFKGIPIEEDTSAYAYRGLPQPIKDLLGVKEKKWVDRHGKEGVTYTMDGTKKYMLETLLGRGVSVPAKLFSIASGDTPALKGLGSMATGIQSNTYDLDYLKYKAEKEERERVMQELERLGLVSGYSGYGVNTKGIQINSPESYEYLKSILGSNVQ